jgi:hypothetical protein
MSSYEIASARHKKHLDPDHPYKDDVYKAVYDNYADLILKFYAQQRRDYFVYSIEEHGANMKDFVKKIQVRHRELISTSEQR